MSKLGKICYLVSGLSLLIMLVARLILQGWIDYLYFPLGFGVLTFFIALIADYKFYLEFMTMRTTKNGLNMGSLVIMALALLVAVNFLGKRFETTFDLTQEKINSLSDQTIQALKDLKSDLKIIVFYRSSDDKTLRTSIKQNYRLYTDASPKVKIQFVDALLDVDLAKKYLSEAQRFAVILEYETNRVVVEENYDEEKTTSAILKVVRKEPKAVYFLTGHGEKDIDSEQADGLKMLAEGLRADAYTVAKLNLQLGDKMPGVTSVIVIAGPKAPLLDSELEQLRTFAKQGGRLLVAADPGEKHNLALLTRSLGVEFKNNYILNEFEQMNNFGPLGTLGAEYDRESAITKKFYESGRVMGSVFMSTSEVERASDASTDLTFKELVKSAPQAYVSAQPKAEKSPERKSVPIGISVQGRLLKEEAGREFIGAIFGDSDFMTSAFLRFGANRDLAINTISFLSDDLAKISIRPKSLKATPLELTDTKQVIVILAGVGLPLILIILSGLFWYRRRNL